MHYSKQQSGYVLLLVMLLIGSLGLYLTYEVSTQKIKTQSWQLQKTATEMSYWMDTEYNYATDQGILQSGMNNFSLLDLITNNYLPYGQSRYVAIPSSTLSQVSEFMCSPLPGIISSDGTLQLTPSNFNATCPQSTDTLANPNQHCSITPDTPAYYSCSTTMSKNTTQNFAKAQYYINANNIAVGNLINVLAGVGLIIRTPGLSNPHVTSSLGQMGILPNNSIAQSLISLLPTSSFNMYTTNSSVVNGIGIGTYIYDTSGAPVIKNDRYSKIIDMGLVQAVNKDQLPNLCCGWNADGTKTGSTLYQPGLACSNVNLPSASAAPPMCIQVDTTKFGPSGSVERCDRIDVLYTMFSDWQNTGQNIFWYLDYNNTRIQTVGTHQEIYLSIHVNNNDTGGYLYSNGISAQSNYLAYLVRCTRNSIP